ncbi:hypothetical protein [Photobacterium leiognathi]|uniref:hypothetical protein n=1 Tax=Photobacterium leiognathi TaxID=553611 RepID=UPI002980F783|nr:hypothetical protein [Photobacterium leiognathi]
MKKLLLPLFFIVGCSTTEEFAPLPEIEPIYSVKDLQKDPLTEFKSHLLKSSERAVRAQELRAQSLSAQSALILDNEVIENERWKRGHKIKGMQLEVILEEQTVSVFSLLRLLATVSGFELVLPDQMPPSGMTVSIDSGTRLLPTGEYEAPKTVNNLLWEVDNQLTDRLRIDVWETNRQIVVSYGDNKY